MVFLKKIIIFALNLILLTVSGYCQNAALISGSFKGLNENDKVYLYSTKNFKDSAYIKNGVFKFKNFYPQEKGIYFILAKYKSERFDFPLFITENSQLQFEVNKNFKQYKISGDKNAKEQNNFYQGRITLSNQYSMTEKKILETKDSAKLFKLREEINYNSRKINDYVYNWVTTHKSSPFSVAVIRLFIAKNPLSGVEDTLAEKYFDALLPEAKKNNSESDLLESGFERYNDKYSRLQVGSVASNFTIKDTSGKEVKITDFKNNYLLIDFWASWCSPCRINNPYLQELYNNYKEKGLIVLSISMDTDIQKWKEAIKKDDMTWLQGADLLGEYAGVGSQYRITAVPTYILVNPNKKIIMKSVGGDVDIVREKLNEIYK